MNKDTVNKIIDHFKKTYNVDKVTLLDKPVAFSYMSENKDNITMDNVKYETAWSFCDDDNSSIRLYIYNQNKPKLIIDKVKYLNFMLSDNQDRKTVTDMFLQKGVHSVSIDDILKTSSYLPEHVIVNSKDIDILDMPDNEFATSEINRYTVIWQEN